MNSIHKTDDSMSHAESPAIDLRVTEFPYKPDLMDKGEKHVAPRSKVDAHLVSLVAPESIEAEQYRILRYVVERYKSEKGSVIGICSSLPGEGKSLTAINLAGALAQDPNSKVLLIEADMRHPAATLLDHLSLSVVPGRALVDALMDPSLSIEERVLHLQQFNLSVLPAGKCSMIPYEAIKSPRFGELIEQARQRYDYVILDTPPVISVPDTRLLAKWIDGYIMVVAAHRTPRDAVQEALGLLDSANIMGLVLNNCRRFAMQYYGSGYGHSAGRQLPWWNRVLKR